nr:hypothetical protein [Corallococcus carmarthensis]
MGIKKDLGIVNRGGLGPRCTAIDRIVARQVLMEIGVIGDAVSQRDDLSGEVGTVEALAVANPVNPAAIDEERRANTLLLKVFRDHHAGVPAVGMVDIRTIVERESHCPVRQR